MEQGIETYRDVRCSRKHGEHWSRSSVEPDGLARTLSKSLGAKTRRTLHDAKPAPKAKADADAWRKSCARGARLPRSGDELHLSDMRRTVQFDCVVTSGSEGRGLKQSGGCPGQRVL
jgi:hypothetical protein